MQQHEKYYINAQWKKHDFVLNTSSSTSDDNSQLKVSSRWPFLERWDVIETRGKQSQNEDSQK